MCDLCEGWLLVSRGVLYTPDSQSQAVCVYLLRMVVIKVVSVLCSVVLIRLSRGSIVSAETQQVCKINASVLNVTGYHRDTHTRTHTQLYHTSDCHQWMCHCLWSVNTTHSYRISAVLSYFNQPITAQEEMEDDMLHWRHTWQPAARHNFCFKSPSMHWGRMHQQKKRTDNVQREVREHQLTDST